MRIDWLRIPGDRNLRNFEIDFDETQPTTVLLGRNGSGKSNLIEAIVRIFRDLELGAPPSFAYQIRYVCREQTIEIDADPERTTKRLEVKVNGGTLSQTAFQRDTGLYLPKYVFAYYSGWSSRLERHFDQTTRKYYDGILRNPDREMPLRRMFFCRKEYSQLVLLAFFLAPSDKARDLLAEHLGIRSFVSALFVLKTPWWGTSRPGKAQAAEGDRRFWYARGAFKSFLARLWEESLAPMRSQESVDRDVRRQGESTERLYLFIKNQQQLERLRTGDETARELFAYLESLFLCDLIDEVRVTVERTDGERVKFTQLSEGEQQLLTVLGLLLFTQDDESLYLLDEPDTHLNPVWTYEFLGLLQANIRADKGQLIVTTHNPLMIGTLKAKQVRIIEQTEQGTRAVEPDFDPIGIGIEGLLKSELYGLRSSLAPEVLKKLDRHYLLLGIEQPTEDERTELMKLATELNEMAVSRTHPNPYFEHFANAMARRAPASKASLTAEEVKEQSKLADQLLLEVLEEEKQEESQA